MRKNQEIFVDHMNDTIYVSADFIKKAGIPGTYEYETFKIMKNDNPAYKIERKTVSSSKKVYKGLTIDRMRDYIALKDKAAMEDFNHVCAEARVRGHAYPRVKSWFVHKYKDYANDPIWEDDDKIIDNTAAA